ncbi:MAG TPA: tRNA (adenosine(37)-N6)-threonylcarbamoyltransferase complex ATPase subunit type 1 TsaE [Opitutaceae bacterium]|nr:tRNA (adenosine(37)-N6)-threonylcarbamoyltransferase complex ATPase subunit type 1 TsaE [Opitutaceae bacterium]
MATSIYARLRAGISTHSAEQMRTLAAELATALSPDRTLALHGDLGVGKTTFVQGLAHGLGIRDAVTSPTFNIFTVHRGATNLVHLDAYRLENARQIDDLLLEDFLVSPWCLAIEWPEKIATWIPPDALHLDLSIAPGEAHRIRLR